MSRDNRESKAQCFEAEGEWSYGSHMLASVALKKGVIAQYDVKISCRGRYEVHVGVSPKETVSVIADSDGRNAYVETVYSEDGVPHKRYLKPHNIRYSLTITSLTDFDQVIKIEEPWTLPTYPAGLPSASIRIPYHFGKGERFRISISIDADKAFYEDYKWVGASIRVPLH